MENSKKYILTFSCDDRPGIVAKVSGLLFEKGANILSARQFKDGFSKRFFMRVVFVTESEVETEIKSAIADLADALGFDWRLSDKARKKRVIIMVSKFDHCLADLLYRSRIGELDMEIVGIISNHPLSALSPLNLQDIPFHHLPITKDTKPQQEADIQSLIDDTGAELIILARYMQILSNDFCRVLEGKCINIHHSFLPGFKGAKPYHQAFERGVKMIGATAHFVTTDLDEGPIIAQDVEQITHTDTPKDLIRKGRNIEQRVLSQAVSYFLEDRILLNGQKTVVFA